MQVQTEWRILKGVPGTDNQSLDDYEYEDFDAMEPFTPNHPIAAEALTEPPIGSMDLTIGNLQDYEVDMWPDQHVDCYDYDADPPPESCDECGVPVYHAPSPLQIGAEGEDYPFVTVGDYVRELGAWLESGPVARDVYEYLAVLEGQSVVCWTAIPFQQQHSGLDSVSFSTFADFEVYEKATRRGWAESLKQSADEREQWAERSWAIAEAMREK